MSESRPPGWIAAMPAYRASSVVFDQPRGFVRRRLPPTKTVTAESAWKPSQIAPKSSERTSPSFSFRLAEGIPWTISASIEAQITAGYVPL